MRFHLLLIVVYKKPKLLDKYPTVLFHKRSDKDLGHEYQSKFRSDYVDSKLVITLVFAESNRQNLSIELDV